MAYFVAEFTPNNSVPTSIADTPGMWILYVDDASNNKGARLRVVLYTPDGTIIEQSYSLGFRATNNEAEYEGLIAGLKMVEALGVKSIEVRCDSMLVVNQINGDFACKEDRMESYTQLVFKLRKKFASALSSRFPGAKTTTLIHSPTWRPHSIGKSEEKFL